MGNDTNQAEATTSSSEKLFVVLVDDSWDAICIDILDSLYQVAECLLFDASTMTV